MTDTENMKPGALKVLFCLHEKKDTLHKYDGKLVPKGFLDGPNAEMLERKLLFTCQDCKFTFSRDPEEVKEPADVI